MINLNPIPPIEVERILIEKYLSTSIISKLHIIMYKIIIFKIWNVIKKGSFIRFSAIQPIRSAALAHSTTT